MKNPKPTSKKRIKANGFAFLHKKDKTLLSFAMPTKEIEDFFTMVENTKQNSMNVVKGGQYKVVKVEIIYSVPPSIK